METKITLKEALEMVRSELKMINIPAEQVFTIGVHVGRALGILNDCMNSLREPEEKTEECEIEGIFAEPEDGESKEKEPNEEGTEDGQDA